MTRRPRRPFRRPFFDDLELRRLLAGGTLSITVSPTEIAETPGRTAIFTATRTGDTSTTISVPIIDDANSTVHAGPSYDASHPYKLTAISPATFGSGYLTIPAGSTQAQLQLTVMAPGTGSRPDLAVLDVGTACGPPLGGGCGGGGNSSFLPTAPSTATLTLDHATLYAECPECPQLALDVLAPGAGAGPSPRAEGVNSDLGLITGESFQDHRLVAYSSQGQDRAIDLQYSSLQADPRPIVQATLLAVSSTGPGSPAIASIAPELLVDGVSQGAPVAYAVSTLAGGMPYTIALQAASASASLATGIHTSLLKVTETFSDGSTYLESLPGTLDVVNRSSISYGPSYYGAGWSIGGLQAIVTNAPTNSVLIAGGSQGTMEFTSTDATNFVGPPGDTSTLAKNPGGTWTRTYADGTVLQFDANGREASAADRNGNTTTYAYVAAGAAAGALGTITDPVGRVTTLAYDASGKLSTVADPAGRVTTFTVDSNGNLTRAVDPDSAAEQYGYATAANHRITTEVGPNNQTATVTYDAYGRVQSETLFGATGTTTLAPAQEQGLAGPLIGVSRPVATVTDPGGHATTLSFDGMYLPLTSADATTGSSSSTYVRDDRGWVISATDPDGRTTTYSYDGSGNLAGQTRNDGTSMSITYGVASRPTRVTDYRGLITTYALDTRGNVTRRTDPDLLHEDWTYNPAGQVLTDTDRNGHTTTSAYDAYGRVTSVTGPTTTPTGTSDVATGGTASSPSGGNVPYAFDQSPGTKWTTSSIAPALTYHFAAAAAYAVTQYAITSGDDTALYTGRAPKSWTFQGSNDGITWATLDTISNQADTLSLDTRYYQVAAPASYGYYRLNVSANNGDPSLTQIQELQLLVPPTPAPNVATGGTASSPSGGNVPYAFDQSPGTKWTTSSIAPALTYHFAAAAAYAVTQYAITSGDDTALYTGRAPKSWTFQGSNDGTTWATLDQRANQADTLSLDTRYYQVALPASYGYYRLNVSANNGDPSLTQIQELQLLVPPPPGSGSDVATGGTASSPSGGNVPYAFDQSPGTKWTTSSIAPALTYHFAAAAAYAVTQYAITSGDDTALYTGRAPKSWTFQGSNDGITWATLDTISNQADTLSLDTRYYQVAAPASYGYYRLNVSANNGDPSLTQIQELQLLVPPTPAPNVATGGTASSPSGGNVPYAFDQSPGTKWTTSSIAPALTYHFAAAAAYAVTQYAITSGDDTALYTGRAPKSWTFQGSNDGTTWATLDQRANQADTLSLDTRYYQVALPASYGYYRLNVSANNGDPSLTQIQELQLLASPARVAFGYDAAGDVTSTVDELGNTRTSTYDPAGRVLSSRDPVQAAAGRATSSAYDADGNPTSITDALGHVTSYAYDARDRLISMTDPANQGTGHATTFAYDGMNRISETDPDGRTTTFAYDGQGRTTGTTDPLGHRTTWTYDNAGLLTSVTDPLGRVTSHGYDAAGREVTVTDPLNHTTTITYNADDQVTSVTDALGRATSYGYDNLGRRVTVTDALNHTTTSGYDNAGNRTTVTDPLGHTTTMAYDARDRLVSQTAPSGGGTTVYTYDAASDLMSVTDPLGRLTSYRHDAAGREVAVIDPLGHATTTAYDVAGEVTAVTDPLGRVTSFGHDADGRRVTTTDPLGHTTTVAYDAAGQVTAVTDPLGRATSLGYDAAGRRVTVTDPLSHTTTTAYDAADQVTAVTDPLGRITSFGYDAAGRRVTVTDPLSHTTTTAYDAADQVTAVTDANGHATTITHDAAGRAVAVTDALNHIVTTTYDAAGRRTAVTDALGQTTSFGYDAADRRITVTDPLGATTTTAYDAADQVTAVSDPLGHTTSSTYDAAGRPTAVIDALGHATSFAYDAADERTSVTDPAGNVTTTAYDAAGRATGAIDPNGQRTTLTYDAADQVTSRVDRNGRRTDYAHDAAGRLVTETWIAAGVAINTITHTYDAADQVTALADASATLGFTYDNAGRIATASTSSPAGQPPVTLTEGYDAAGNRTGLADNLASAGSTGFAYDAADRLATIAASYGGSAGPAVALGYDAADRPTSTARTIGGTGTAITSALAYDATDRITTITHGVAGGPTLATYAYGYDAADRLIAETNAEGAISHAYDATDQLTATSGPAAATYTYDPNGNRTMTGYATAADNRLSSGAGSTYTYDNEGNLTAKTQAATGNVWAYTYDYHNRLTGVTETNPGHAVLMQGTYTYDPLGRRIGVDETVAGTQTRTASVYDGANVYADFDGSGNLLDRYLDGPAVDQVLARTSASGTTAWYLTDHEGSVRDLVSTSGTALDHIAYDGFGNVTAESSPANGDRFKYDGMQFDQALGVYDDNARYYDPATGRFLEEDPTGFAAGDANLYRYVANSPTNATDPTGLQGWGDFQFGGNSYTLNPFAVTSWNPLKSVIAVGADQTAGYVGSRLIFEPVDFRAASGTKLAAAAGLGTVQGALNTVNGVQDVAVDLANLPALAYNNTAGRLGGGRIGYFRSPGWAKSLVVHEDDTSHFYSQLLGGTGLSFLFTAPAAVKSVLGKTMGALPCLTGRSAGVAAKAGTAARAEAAAAAKAPKGMAPDPEVIRGIKALPDGARLTPSQISELNKNIDVILNKTLPAKAASSRGSIQDTVNLFKNDPRFRFLNQIPGAVERIEAALQQYGGSLK